MRRLKKYQAGEATHYISRRQALKKLQLSLNDFRRLCIIKGIYPREPKNRRRAQKGSTDIKILYHAKDIKFLLHEPIVWTLRKYKIFNRQTGRDRAVRDFRNLKRRLDKYPELKIDHIVKERYPTFIDAIRDLDDCLTLLFLFSTFPSLKYIPRDQSALCRRLTVEFMHAVIASKALRKVFISIKGYYFQAEIKGEKVTWIIPHYYPFAKQSREEVDFKVMSIFVEFFTVMLGFVNFRLYNTLNLLYPPQFPTTITEISEGSALDEKQFVSERIAALNIDLMRKGPSENEEDEAELDLELLTTEGDSEKVLKMQEEAVKEKKLRTLFKGLKFFINREVPREPLVLIIRCFGGNVSWDKILFPGATFDETDEGITHQIVDRPNLGKQYISRDYVQPQWLFDCVNQKKLIPTNKYFIGAILPPHLSPFTDELEDNYIPPEEKTLRDPSLIETHKSTDDESSEEENDKEDQNKEKNIKHKKQANKRNEKSKKKFTESSLDAQLEKAYWQEKQEEDESNKDSDKDKIAEDEKIDDKKLKIRQELKLQMGVKTGEIHKEDPQQAKLQEIQEQRLKARMVKPRHRNLFRKLIKDKVEKGKERHLLENKRRRIEAGKKEENYKKKKQQQTDK